MKVYFDTNVLLDVLQARQPFVVESRRVWGLAEQRRIDGLISVLTLPNIYYVARRISDRSAALAMVRQVRVTFGILACDEGTVDRALASDFPDFEDAIQYFCASKARVDCVLTRDAGHFALAAVPVLSPEQFLATYTFE